MSELWQRAGFALLAVFIACGLAFGAGEAFGSKAVLTCGDDLGEIDTCPPKNNFTCNQACLQEEFFGGSCIQGCCVCLT